MKKRLLIVLLVLTVIAALTWYFWPKPQAENAHSLTLYGNVDLRQVNLAFQVSGQIQEMQITEGSRVKAGQQLACVDSTRYDSKLALAKAKVAELEAELSKLETGNRPQEIAQAKSQYLATRSEADDAQQNYKRLKTLLPRKLASQQDVDNARAKATTLKHQEQAALEAWNLAKLGAREEDIARVKAQVTQAQAQVALAQKDVEDTRIVAPASGIVRDRILEPGDLAQPQQVVMTLALQSPKWVRAYLNEADLGKVKMGMMAHISTDSYPNKTYEGWVGYISPVAEFTPKTVQTEALRTQLVYQIRIYTCDPNGELRLGMPATITMDLTAAPNDHPQCGPESTQNPSS